ncbi:MAG: tetratricopeptide repeat protein [Candidatus Zixiibacteriota bacterium]|nr:MAG: tetratricopeptide repeat protein [candidate division Zixibacteria bacterium]
MVVLLTAGCLLFAGTLGAQDFTLEEGRRLIEEWEFEQARDVLLKVIEKEPENAEANFLLCKTFVRLDDHDNALKHGKKAVELADSVSDYHLWLGQAHGMQAQKGSKFKAIFRANRARKEFEKAVALDSLSIDARMQLAGYLLSAPGVAGGSKSKAKKQAEIIEQIDSLFGAIAWSTYWERENDAAKAEDYLKSAVRLDTTWDHSATYRLGFFLQRQKRNHEAAEVFDKAFRDYPDQMGLLYQVGRSYIFAEDSLDKAEWCFKEYLKVEPKKSAPQWADAHWRLGMVYDLKGEIDLAIAELEEAVRLEPENKEFQKKLKQLKKKK